MDGIPRSLDYSKFLLVGLRNGGIVECDIKKQIKETIMHSHHDGEVWGLCVLEAHGKFITSGDDNKLLMFDMDTKKCVQRGLISPDTEATSAVTPISRPVGGASTTSSEPPNKQSRALAWNERFCHLAVANNEGQVTVRQISFERGKDMNKVFKEINDSKEWIECLAYSPDNNRLAVGSHDNNIYVYNCTDANYSLFTTLKAHQSFITAFDWSSDSQYIRSNCGAYELLFFNVPEKRHMKDGPTKTVGT